MPGQSRVIGNATIIDGTTFAKPMPIAPGIEHAGINGVTIHTAYAVTG